MIYRQRRLWRNNVLELHMALLARSGCSSVCDLLLVLHGPNPKLDPASPVPREEIRIKPRMEAKKRGRS